MVQGYAKVVNTLFKLRGFNPPADLSDRSNMTGILLKYMLQEEDSDIAQQQAPLESKWRLFVSNVQSWLGERRPQSALTLSPDPTDSCDVFRPAPSFSPCVWIVVGPTPGYD